MRKRNIQKIVRFNRQGSTGFAAKAKKACLSEAGLIPFCLSEVTNRKRNPMTVSMM